VRILFVNREPTLLGGDTNKISHYATHLEDFGIECDYAWDVDTPDFTQYDVIHGFHLGHEFSYKFFLEAQRVKKPYVLSPIYFPQKGMPSGYRDEMLRDADVVLYLSDGEKKFVEEEAGFAAAKSYIVPNGINPIFGADGRHYSHPNARDEDYVLCVGRIDGRKNQARLAQACRNLDVPLLLVGEIAHNEAANQIQVMADEWNGLWWEDKAPPEALAECYRGAKVLACPSTYEIWPNVVAEGGLAGCNLVVSKSSLTFADLDGVFSCFPRTSSIEDAVGKAYAAPRYTGNFDEVFKKYTWERAARRLSEIYKEVVA